MHRQLFLLYYETHWRSGPPDTYIQSHNFLTVPLSGSTINGLAEVLYVNCNQKFKYIDFLKKQKKKWTCWTWNFIFWSTMSNCLLQKLHSIYSQKQWWKVPIFCIFPTVRMVNHFLFLSYYIWTPSALPELACWMMWNSSSWWQNSFKPAWTRTAQLTHRLVRNYKYLIFYATKLWDG